LVGRERLGTPVVQDKQFDPGQGRQEPGVAWIAVASSGSAKGSGLSAADARGSEHFAIEGADGCSLLLPAWMTESWAANMRLVETPILPFVAFLALSELLRYVGFPGSGLLAT